LNATDSPDNAVISGYIAHVGTLAATDLSDTAEFSDTIASGINYYTGVAWVSKPLKVWNGAIWQTKTLKRWNGSSWLYG